MRITLKWKFFIAGIFLEVFLLASISGIIYKFSDDYLDQVVLQRIREMNACLSDQLTHHSADLDVDIISNVTKDCKTQDAITYYVLFDENEHLVAQYDWPGAQLTNHATLSEVNRMVKDIPWTTPSFVNSKRLAASDYRYVLYGGTSIYKSVAQTILTKKILQLCLIILALSLIVSLMVIRWVRRHLRSLEVAANEILQGKYHVTLEHVDMDNTGHVGLAINLMTVPLKNQIQELKIHAENAQQTSERILRMIDAVPDFMLLSRISDAYILYANKGVENMTGYVQTELIGKTLNEMQFGLSKEQRKKMQAELVRQGVLANYESVIRHKNESPINVLISASLLEVDNEPYGLYICRDISDRKLVEAAVGFANRQLSYVLDAASEVSIISVDVNGVVQMFNHGAEKMLGYRAKDQIGKVIRTELHDINELKARCKELSQQFGREIPISEVLTVIPIKNGAETRNWTYICKDGRRLNVSLTITRVPDSSGKIIGFLGIARDITLQLQAERALQELNTKLEKRVEERTAELEESNKTLAKTMRNLQLAQDELVRSEKLTALGDVVAVVAHEINTPIGNCLTVATTMRERSQEMFNEIEQGTVRRSSLSSFVNDTKEGMDILIRGLHRSSELVNNFKQVAVDQTTEQRRQFALHEVVGEVVALMKPKLRIASHTLDINIPEDIIMDSFPGPIEQIITNLINNSILHAFDEGSIGSMKLVATQQGQQLRMVFSDNGRGISEDILNRVFDPFFTTRLGRGGTGLGLNIVHNIAKNMLGGQIEVSSLVGHGTSFVILVPLIAPTNI